MGIGAIIIGDEIMSGRRQDKHLAKVIEALKARGMALDWARYQGDDRPRLIEALRQSFASGDIVFSFGGIGATPDDHTRQSAAAALNLPMALHPEAEKEIRARFGAEVSELRLQLGVFPVGAEIVPNPFNRMAGFSIREHYFLPGFPEMAWPMMEWVLDTCYPHLHHAEEKADAAIIVFEAMEGLLIDLMQRITADYPKATLFSLPSFGNETVRRHIELGMKGEPASVAAAMQEIREEITRRGYEWVEKG